MDVLTCFLPADHVLADCKGERICRLWFPNAAAPKVGTQEGFFYTGEVHVDLCWQVKLIGVNVRASVAKTLFGSRITGTRFPGAIVGSPARY